jgi:hypothetical protein
VSFLLYHAVCYLLDTLFAPTFLQRACLTCLEGASIMNELLK